MDSTQVGQLIEELFKSQDQVTFLTSEFSRIHSQQDFILNFTQWMTQIFLAIVAIILTSNYFQFKSQKEKIDTLEERTNTSFSKADTDHQKDLKDLDHELKTWAIERMGVAAESTGRAIGEQIGVVKEGLKEQIKEVNDRMDGMMADIDANSYKTQLVGHQTKMNQARVEHRESAVIFWANHVILSAMNSPFSNPDEMSDALDMILESVPKIAEMSDELLKLTWDIQIQAFGKLSIFGVGEKAQLVQDMLSEKYKIPGKG